MDAASALVSVDQVRAAERRLRGVVASTPLVDWDEQTRLKLESLQPTGSFKIRGAYSRLSLLSAEERHRGVITYSSGNHAQAVARAARRLGISALIVMPRDAPSIKVERVIEDGAEILWSGSGSDERRQTAERIARDTKRVLVPPYDDLDVIAGQGTIGLEILQQAPRVTSVLIPIGGGGLASGIAAVIKALRPETRVIGVEPELASDARESLQHGEIVQWAADLTVRTIAEGLRAQSIGRITFEHLRRFVDDIVTASESEIAAATLTLAEKCHLLVEPSGAVAFAAHLSGKAGVDEERVIIVSGGNVSLDRLVTLHSSSDR
jgi:threonine dehydratase